MVKLSLKPLKRNKRKYSSYKGTVGKIAENLIERDFNAEKPNQKWYTDVTEFNLRGEKCYLSPILDGYNGEVISYNTSKSPNLEQVNDMLNKAFDGKNLEGLIFHSDQGWQYQHQSYQQRLKNNGIKQSMSRKGNSMDNGMMENFFGILKTEMFYDQEDNYKTFMELNTLMSFVSIVICGSLSFAINPFINIFYEGEIVTSKVLAFCFILMLFISINSSTLCVYTNSTGLFKETKVCTITEAVTNLVLSIIGMILFGIPGILIATSISYIVADYIIKPKILYKNTFKKKSTKEFYLNFLITTIIFIISYILNSFIKINVSSLFLWFIVCLGLFAINLIVVYFIFKFLKMDLWINRIKKMIRRKLKNES